MSVTLPFYYLSLKEYSLEHIYRHTSLKNVCLSKKQKASKIELLSFPAKESLNWEISFLTNAVNFYKMQI